MNIQPSKTPYSGRQAPIKFEKTPNVQINNSNASYSIQQVEKDQTNTTLKTHESFQHIIKNIETFFKPVNKFAASILTWLDWKVSELFMNMFPTKTRQKANDLFIGNYKGETLENAPIKKEEGKTVASTARELLCGIFEGNKTIEKPEKISKPNSDPFEEIEVPEQFKKDLSRAEYRLNGEVVYNHREFEDVKKQEEKNDVLFEACQKIKNKFNSEGFTNITKILNQSIMANSMAHLLEKGNLNPKNANVVFGNRRDLPLIYEIKEKDSEVHLMITTIVLANDFDDPEKTLGYVTVQKNVIIPVDELAKDWSNTDLKDVAPNLKVVDRYSPYCETLGIAKHYFNDFQRE